MLNQNRTSIISNGDVNSNFSIPVIVKTNLYDWHVKNKTGIVRKRLEYVSVDGPRLTSLVQYPAGLTFKKCSHKRGEEFLVLSGDYSNEENAYRAGSYVRNPPGMKFASSTEHGCTLLFKTGHFQKMDQTQLVINAHDYNDSWVSAGVPGVSRFELHQFLDESVHLYQIRPQCWITFKQYAHGIELLVCEGSVTVAGIKYTAGSWFRYPPHSRIKITSVSNVCLFVKKESILANKDCSQYQISCDGRLYL